MDLSDEIPLLAAQLDAATHRLLTCIRRFDEGEGWLRQGARSCADWLAWRVGLDTATAREKVRVARALGQLPSVDGALARGELSYAKVRAVTRVATPENEGVLCEMALQATGAQLERICRRFRRVRNEIDGFDEGENDLSWERALRVRPLASGLVRVEITLRPDEADLVLQAIEKVRDQLRASSVAAAPADVPPADVPVDGTEANRTSHLLPLPGRAIDGTLADRTSHRLPLPGRADAMVLIAEQTLAAGNAAAEPDEDAARATPSAGRYQVLVHLDRSVLGPDGEWDAFLDDGTRVSAEAFRRLSCDGGLVAALHGGGGETLDIGRRTRAIPPAIRRALWLRDRGCRFPGCSNRRFVHGHHIRHWAHGGETSLENLVLLCSFHHGLVHEGGFRVCRDSARELTFREPSGAVVVQAPRAAPARQLDDEGSLIFSIDDPERVDQIRHRPDLNLCPWEGEPVDYDAAVDTLVWATAAASAAAPAPD
jgi:hypothetical protein